MKIAYRKAYSNVPFLSIRNIEHSLCEFRKYRRIRNEKPCRKRLFRPKEKLIFNKRNMKRSLVAKLVEKK